MTLDDIQALIWVHQHGSLLAAAKSTGVSRTTLRRRLDRVDQALGRKAIVSGGVGFVLTAAGRALVQEGAELIGARDRLLTRARRADAEEQRLRVLIEHALPPEVVARLHATVVQMLPDVCLEMVFDPDPRGRSGEHFDAVLYFGDAPLSVGGFTRALLRASFVVQASAAYLAQYGTPQEPADLIHHRVLHRAGTPASWPLLKGGRLVIDPAQATSDLFTLGLLAGEGLGLALLPRHAMPVHPAIDSLVPVLEDTVGEARSLRLDMPTPASPNSAAAKAIALIQQLAPHLTE